VLSVAAGGDNTCALLGGGTVKCWGDNSYNQLGPDVAALFSAEPLTYPGLAGVDEIGVGAGFACARVGASVKCWGRNQVGQLGDGTIIDRDSPVDVRF
jgi:alpha-tubulin suppressor-like RCC1 family protein